MTDYDDVRTCCSEAKMCNKCFKYLTVGYKILDQALREDFGFKSIMWVFSGRRGVHCWVGDSRARKLTNEGRSAIANYLKWKTINKNTGLNFLMKEPLYPHIERALSIIEEHFEEYVLIGQDVLNSEKIIEIVMMILKAYLSNSQSYSRLEYDVKGLMMNKRLNSVEKWKKMENMINEHLVFSIQGNNKGKEIVQSRIRLALKEIQMAIMYPRLDINVSKHINHLLKSPFVVHPKTGYISVPLNDYMMENFDFEAMPLLKETIEDCRNKKDGKFLKFMEIFEESIKTFNTD
jgi:DNA primase small subunit